MTYNKILSIIRKLVFKQYFSCPNHKAVGPYDHYLENEDSKI